MTAAAELVARRNRRVASLAALVALAMLALGYAAVPLYRLFCQATGFAGTTRRVTEAQARQVRAVAGRTISIRFDGNVAAGMPWEFHPEQVTETVRLGERSMAFFVARNKSARPITGNATFNVSPEQTGKYFNKIQCFCFTEQTLRPGEEARMPVVFYVDPAIARDPDASDVEQITLSYTFNEDRSAGGGEARNLRPGPAKPLDRPAGGR